jgi:hypothetical protein
MPKLCYCRTPDCSSGGIPFEWDDTPAEGVTKSTPWCGDCSTEFVDIVDVEGGPPIEQEPPG